MQYTKYPFPYICCTFLQKDSHSLSRNVGQPKNLGLQKTYHLSILHKTIVSKMRYSGAWFNG